jgi:hypothetical protein
MEEDDKKQLTKGQKKKLKELAKKKELEEAGG